MHIDPYMVLGSAIVGLLVGITGAGGGALMTPMLIFFFSVEPSKAISSDLVASVFMRPPAALVHAVKKTVNWRLVRFMAAGSVPMAFLGAYILSNFGDAKKDTVNIEYALGGALLLGAAAMVLRFILDTRSTTARNAEARDLVIKPVPTILVGMLGGLIVGMTSVGSGSLMIVLLLFLYPMIGAKRLVGTDLTQAVPLTLAAALGALAFTHVVFGVTAAIVVGGLPAALLGSFFSSRVPDQFIRPFIMFVIFISGMKYVGLTTDDLVWAGAAALVVGALGWLAISQPWRKPPVGTEPELTSVGPSETR